MYKNLFLLFFLLFKFVTIYADELKVISFKKDVNCLDARINEYKRLDDNDEPCAIIKIRTDYEYLQITAYPLPIGNIPKIKGEYWVYVSPGTREISFFGKNVKKIDYIIPVQIRSYDVYILELKVIRSDTKKLISKLGDLFIITDPPGAYVELNNVATGSKTPFHYTPIENTYYCKIFKPGFKIVDTTVSVKKNKATYLNVNLKPELDNVKNNNNTETSKLNVNIKTEDNKPITLFIDGKSATLKKNMNTFNVTKQKHKISITGKCYKPIDSTINVTQNLNIILKPKNVCGTLVIKSGPSANIFIDKEKKGVEFVKVNLFEGYHLIEIKGNNIESFKKILYIEPNKTDSLNVFLENKNTSISIQTSPSNAKVILDNKKVGTTPLLLNNIKLGKHTVLIQKKGYGTIIDTLFVQYSSTFNLFKKLEKGKKFTVVTTPSNSEIFINNTFIGTSSLQIELAIDSFDLKITKKGYPVYKQKIYLQNINDTLKCDLTHTPNGPKMIYVKGGCYYREAEWTLFKVCVSDFYISKYEITNKEFCEYLNYSIINNTTQKNEILKFKSYGPNISYDFNKKRYKVNEGFENYPVTQINWYDAENYCEWLGGRLPTEAEWLYAAKGGLYNENYKYSGANKLSQVAWYSGNSKNELHPVGKLSPNKLGIYDMSGNANEWCYDWFDLTYFTQCPSQDPRGPLKGDKKVVKGGGYNDKKSFLLITKRRGLEPKSRRSDFGFRLVKLTIN